MYFADRVKDTTQTTGTGAFVLDAAVVAGYQTFAAGLGASPVRCSYGCISAAGLWEVGKGTFDGTTGLTREVVRSGSSGPGVLVNFAAGAKDIFLVMTAEQADNANIGLQYANARGMLGW